MSATSANSSLAQVWVGEGVRIRAPFVRVDVGPYGGVSVRAPFTAVDVPPRDYFYDPGYPPTYFERRVVEPSLPTAAELAGMDDEQLSQALLAISQRLYNRLNRFDTGATWQRYFRLPAELVDASASRDARASAIAALLDKFRTVAADPRYSMIARLPQFISMEAVLNEALSRPHDAQTPSANNAEELPSPAQQPPPSQPLPPPQRPTDSAERDDPFLQPRPPQ